MSKDLNNDLVQNNRFSASDFELVQSSEKIHDQKFESKPTTFLKDSFKRFCKNKSSIVATFILGIIILLAIFLPMFSPYDIDTVRKPEQFLAPKLFEAGTGFWDGTKSYHQVAYDVDEEKPVGYYKPAVIDIKVNEEPTLINQATSYGKKGYVMFENQNNVNKVLSSQPFTFTSADNITVKITLNDEEGALGSKLGEYSVYLTNGKSNEEKETILLQDYCKNYDELSFNISEALTKAGHTEFTGRLAFELKPIEGAYSYILLESVVFSANDTLANASDLLEGISFEDATAMVLAAPTVEVANPIDYWVCTGRKGVYKSVVYYCDFVYDTYAAAYDAQEITYAYSDINTFISKKYMKFNYNSITGEFTYEILSDKCPLDSITSVQTNEITGKVLSVTGQSYRYKKYGYTSMPKFLFGTDESGHDLVKKAFAGLRTSLILGVCTALFCFVFGLIWGSISGYFGGNVDLFMERFCDILGGVPWIVVMTLCILHLGNNFGTFFIALCATGWMGTAARTRTQFYRFKGREYVLASRTLGSSDIRLIFKHILPNSLGTIITSSVFMITSVIFSEASLAYLNLGLQGVHSFGVMISNNQKYITESPNLVVFPAIIVSLLMISFNLFGNGLRDAVNPSLKGSD